HLRHHPVQQDQVRLLELRGPDAGERIGGLHDVEAFTAEHHGAELAHRRIVVHDQNFRHHYSPARSALRDSIDGEALAPGISGATRSSMPPPSYGAGLPARTAS